MTWSILARDPEKDGIKLYIDIAPDACVCIRPLALQQVLLNLILNARAAMRGKPGELRITAQHCPFGISRISVSDTAPGINPSLASTIFQPFVTGQPTREVSNGSTVLTGTGLGLALCKQLVEQAGGSIAGASLPGHGAKFTITLPTADVTQHLVDHSHIPSRSQTIAA